MTTPHPDDALDDQGRYEVATFLEAIETVIDRLEGTAGRIRVVAERVSGGTLAGYGMDPPTLTGGLPDMRGAASATIEEITAMVAHLGLNRVSETGGAAHEAYRRAERGAK